jgi:hypothetical protein
MKQSLLILFFSCLTSFVFCQNELEINFEEIKSTIEDSKSDFYYPTLLKRFNKFDSTLTNKEYGMIYYGFSFQDDYLKNKPGYSTLDSLYKGDDYKAIIKECNKILKLNPVSLKANEKLGFALYKLGKPQTEWKKYQNRYRALRKVIAYSGNGLSQESAFKVIYVEDEYNMLYSYFETKKIFEQSLIGICDKFIIEPSDYYKVSEIYFDISRKLLRTNELMNKK